MNPLLLGFTEFLLLLAATGAFIAMIVILLLALIQNGSAMAARDWTSTDGVIVKSFISSERDDDDPKGLAVIYAPNVSYTYFAQGVQMVAHKIHFGSPIKHTARNSAEKKLAKYPVGAAVTVYYNPEVPSDAVLERTSPQAGRFGWLAVAVLVGGLVACAFAFLLPGWVS
jgi:hypothetical protein